MNRLELAVSVVVGANILVAALGVYASLEGARCARMADEASFVDSRWGPRSGCVGVDPYGQRYIGFSVTTSGAAVMIKSNVVDATERAASAPR